MLQVFNTPYILGKIDLCVCEFCPSVSEYATAMALPSIMNRSIYSAMCSRDFQQVWKKKATDPWGSRELADIFACKHHSDPGVNCFFT